MNASHHAALVHAANCISMRSDLLHMVENLKIAYGMSWKSSQTSWKKIGQDTRYKSLKLIDGSVYRNIPVESAETWWSYVIHRTDDVNSGGSETERPRCFWMHMIIPWNGILAVKNDGMNLKQNDCAPYECLYVSKVSFNGASTILFWSFQQLKGCIVTSIQSGVIGLLST